MKLTRAGSNLTSILVNHARSATDGRRGIHHLVVVDGVLLADGLARLVRVGKAAAVRQEIKRAT